MKILPKTPLIDQALIYAKYDYGLTLSAANTIVSPGRFEGEHALAVLFYEWMMNGDGETAGNGLTRIELSEEESEELQTLENLNDTPKYVILEISNDGFISYDYD